MPPFVYLRILYHNDKNDYNRFIKKTPPVFTNRRQIIIWLSAEKRGDFCKEADKEHNDDILVGVRGIDDTAG